MLFLPVVRFLLMKHSIKNNVLISGYFEDFYDIWLYKFLTYPFTRLKLIKSSLIYGFYVQVEKLKRLRKSKMMIKINSNSKYDSKYVLKKSKKVQNKKNPEEIRDLTEPTTGLEPVTSSLPRKHSTAELSRR